MTVLLGAPGVYEVDASEQLALQALADGGLLPELRMVPKVVEPRRLQA
jgi:hypothetical protein